MDVRGPDGTATRSLGPAGAPAEPERPPPATPTRLTKLTISGWIPYEHNLSLSLTFGGRHFVLAGVTDGAPRGAGGRGGDAGEPEASLGHRP
jgi:hypothetical protein